MVSELVCDELVPPGELLAGEAEQDAVHRAEVVQVTRVVHLLVQLHVEGDLEVVIIIIDVIILSGHRVMLSYLDLTWRNSLLHLSMLLFTREWPNLKIVFLWSL